MSGTSLGAHKSAAKKAGCSLEEWQARREAGERWCYRCRAWKSVGVFSRDCTGAGGYAPICQPCNSIRSKRSKYGLSEEDFDRLAAVGVCPICERSGVPMEIDHDHATGAVRAILCSRCNSGIGMFCEDVELFKRAIAYLETHKNG